MRKPTERRATNPPGADPSCETTWHHMRHLALQRLETLAAEIRRSDDPEADAALADLRPMIRLLSQEAADLRTVHAIEHQWRQAPAWLDLQQQAPALFEPLQQALTALRTSLTSR